MTHLPVPRLIPELTQKRLPGAKVRFHLQEPELLLVDHFLTGFTCQEIIDRHEDKVKPVGFVDKDGNEILSERRTSEGCPMDPSWVVTQHLDELFEEVFLWPGAMMEPTYFVRYRPDQHIDAHFDFFGPEQVTAKGYQRVGTALIYLNSTEDEGTTVYDQLGLRITPHEGSLLFMNYPTASRDNQTRHGSETMESNTKYVLIKWFTSHPVKERLHG